MPPASGPVPPPEQAIALPVPELAVKLLAHLVACKDASGPHTHGLPKKVEIRVRESGRFPTT